MNADGSDVQQLTDSPALDAVPAYSPNGAQIVFSSDRSGKDTRRLFVMATTGANQTRLIAGSKPKEQMSADWQPVHGAKDPCTIRGTINADQLVGTAKADVICGLGGGDTITGGRRPRCPARRERQRRAPCPRRPGRPGRRRPGNRHGVPRQEARQGGQRGAALVG